MRCRADDGSIATCRLERFDIRFFMGFRQKGSNINAGESPRQEPLISIFNDQQDIPIVLMSFS